MTKTTGNFINLLTTTNNDDVGLYLKKDSDFYNKFGLGSYKPDDVTVIDDFVSRHVEPYWGRSYI